jgi:hypothetical protein
VEIKAFGHQLTDDERIRFCDWLEREAHADDAQAKQIEALGPHGKVVADHKRRLCAAKLLVLRELQSIESVSIKPAQNPPPRSADWLEGHD